MKFARQLNQLTQDTERDGSQLLNQKKDQLARLTAYIESNPDDEDIEELLNKKAEVEKEIAELDK